MTPKAEYRQKVILKILEEKGSATIEELSNVLNCSKPTIRKDLYYLEKKGLLSRIINGAKHLNPYHHYYSLFKRSISNNLEKKQIAEYIVSNVINPNSTIILDSGTTTYEIAKEIRRQNFPVTVFTNSIFILTTLSHIPSVRLFSFGGFYNPERGCFEDAFSGHFLNQYLADICFIGINGVSSINDKPALTIVSVKESQTKVFFQKMSTKTIIVCDHSKIMKSESIKVPFDFENLQVITDSNAKDEDIKKLSDTNLNIIRI